MARFIMKKLFLILILTIIMCFGIYFYNVMRQIKHFTNEEDEFPIAYAIVIYKHPDQFHRLMKAIFVRSNIYCIHVDKKSHRNVTKAANWWRKKYPKNVIFPEKFIRIVYPKFSIVDAQLECMKALLNSELEIGKKWKYFINLTGQEWPLKTNLELVRILNSLNGSNLVEKSPAQIERVNTGDGKPPLGTTFYKSSIYIIVVRKFVEYVLYNERAIQLKKYLKPNNFPDESFFGTINNDVSYEAPGGYKGIYFTQNSKKHPFLNRYVIWVYDEICYGKSLRAICIFSMKDVPRMLNNSVPQLFANKFVKGMNDDVLDFVEQWFYNRKKMVHCDTSKNPFIDLEFYKNLDVVKNHF